jgi:hypothetical protein
MWVLVLLYYSFYALMAPASMLHHSMARLKSTAAAGPGVAPQGVGMLQY